jgi:hypothetical protein
MPFHHIPAGQFSLELLKLMHAAYDTVSAKLHIDGSSDPRSAGLANIIMDLAANGERQRLAERSLEAATKLSTSSAERPPSSKRDEQAEI